MEQSIPNGTALLIDEEGKPPKTRAEAAYRQFRQDILLGKLPPGSPLRSDELRRNYNIGISPLREALSRLVSERLVVLNEQRGFYVVPLTIEDVIDTMETRIVLECEALTRSIQSGNLSWETGIVSSFHELSRIGPPKGSDKQLEKWAKHHQKFHMALLAGCNSRWMIVLAKSLFDHAERHRIAAIDNLSEQRDAGTEHQQIMEAALAGNIKAAIAALDHHYRTTADLVVKSISAEQEGHDPEVL